MSGPEINAIPDRPLLERQIGRILDSPEFAGSHRLSDFLRYVCQASLDGRTELDQAEIAHAVLGKDEDFNPVEDAYVRKMAANVRQRLGQYYAGAGKTDPVVILLPQRSYLPRFRLAKPPGPVDAPVAGSGPGRRLLVRLGLVAGALVVAAAVALLTFRLSRPAPPAGSFSIPVHKGGIVLDRSDAVPDAIRLGLPVGVNDQVLARMVFTPQAESDQAGIMIFDDTDNFVVLSRIMRQRTSLHFSSEVRGGHSQQPESFMEDPDGQTGEPIWLAIRRNGEEFRAYTSPDGHLWNPVGPVVHARLHPGASRLAIFGVSDFEVDPPPVALFDRLSVGPPLGTWAQPADGVPESADWHVIDECKVESTEFSLRDAIELTFSDNPNRCRWNMLSEVPVDDWSMTAVVESATWARTFAGMMAIGDKGRVYVVRNSTARGAIVGSTIRQTLFQRPDFPGNPPLVIRLYTKAGWLKAEAGPGRDRMEALPLNLPISDLGRPLRAGLASGRGAYQKDSTLAPVQVYSLGRDVLSLVNYK